MPKTIKIRMQSTTFASNPLKFNETFKQINHSSTSKRSIGHIKYDLSFFFFYLSFFFIFTYETVSKKSSKYFLI